MEVVPSAVTAAIERTEPIAVVRSNSNAHTAAQRISQPPPKPVAYCSPDLHTQHRADGHPGLFIRTAVATTSDHS